MRTPRTIIRVLTQAQVVMEGLYGTLIGWVVDAVKSGG